MNSNKLQLDETSCNLINPAVDRTSTSCLFVSKPMRSKCLTSNVVNTGRIAVLGMCYILFTLPIVTQQRK